MQVSMQKVIVQESGKCSICLDEIKQDSYVLGHRGRDNSDKRIYCHVHEKCMKEVIVLGRTAKCPNCRCDIKVLSVISPADLDPRLTSCMQQEIQVFALIMGICAGSGAGVITGWIDGAHYSVVKLTFAGVVTSLFTILHSHFVKIKLAGMVCSEVSEEHALLTNQVVQTMLANKGSRAERIYDLALSVFTILAGGSWGLALRLMRVDSMLGIVSISGSAWSLLAYKGRSIGKQDFLARFFNSFESYSS